MDRALFQVYEQTLGKVLGTTNTATHVANKYSHTIYVRCDVESRSLEGFSFSSSKIAGFAANYDVEKIRAGFAKIFPGGYMKFQPECKGTNTVYITIFAWNGEGVDLICDNLPKREDMSVIVTESGQVVDTKYGHIWVPA